MVLKDSVALYMASQARRVSRKLPVLIEFYGVSKLYITNIARTFTDHPARETCIMSCASDSLLLSHLEFVATHQQVLEKNHQ